MLFDPVRLTRIAATSARSGLRAGKVPARAAWRRWVLARGRDDTLASARRRCVVVAPHPDDETIGCGATIARKRVAGTDTWVVVVTDGRHSHRSEKIRPLELAALRQQESRTACQMLGVDEGCVRFLGFEEGTLDRCLDDVAAAIGAVVDAVQPDEVLVTSEHDWNLDHQAVNVAVRRALAERRFGGLLGAYPVWFWADGPWRNPPWDGLGPQLRRLLGDPRAAVALPAPYLVSTQGFGDLKRAAYDRYLTQTTNYSGEPDWQAFPDAWIEPFLGHWEAFFPVDLAGSARPPARATAPASGNGAALAGELTSLRDDFADDRLRGQVLGSRSPSGADRLGVDVEGTLGIDDHELRLAALATPGFGRQALTYGPFARRAGLTLAVQVLNGHNTAQSNMLGEGRKAMLRRIVRDLPSRQFSLPFLEDNLAVGFWPQPAPADPRVGGNAFVMHAASTVNGELRARAGGGLLRAYQGIQELPLTYVVCLRPQGAVYFVASLPDAEGMAAFPAMRPVAVDHAGADPVLFAGVTQAVHGEVGHELSTRVSLVRAEVLPELAAAAALVADPLTGDGPLAAEPGPWHLLDGSLTRTGRGTVGTGSALVELSEPAGLVHMVVETAPVFAPEGRAGLLWRAGADGAWRVTVSADRAELARCDQTGEWTVVDEGPAHLPAAGRFSLQVLDDGRQFCAHLDGQLLFDRWYDEDALAPQTGVGLTSGPAARSVVADFEALPRQLPVPAALGLEAPWCEQGERVVVHDRFGGPAGELAGAWERSVGPGRFELTGDGAARVAASVARPNPGRTSYTVPWDDPGFADIEVELTPPGTARGEGHSGRGGLLFLQDDDNYLLVNMWLDDAPHHDGSSISTFFRAQGYERLYDAPWTNVGRRVHWGRPFTLRAAFDGRQMLVWLDGVPVFARRLRDLRPNTPRLRIERVGLVANWEWGDDTGTSFRNFVARAR